MAELTTPTEGGEASSCCSPHAQASLLRARRQG